MTISAQLILILFALIFLGLVIMAVVHLFHAWRFGEHTPLAAITSALFLLGIFLIIGGVVAFLRDVDWKQTYDIKLPALRSEPEQEAL